MSRQNAKTKSSPKEGQISDVFYRFSSNTPPSQILNIEAKEIGSTSNIEKKRKRKQSQEESKGDSVAGRWTKEEHNRFIEAYELYGKEWKKVHTYVGTRTTTQVRSHAQKYFAKTAKEDTSPRKDSFSRSSTVANIPVSKLESPVKKKVQKRKTSKVVTKESMNSTKELLNNEEDQMIKIETVPAELSNPCVNQSTYNEQINSAEQCFTIPQNLYYNWQERIYDYEWQQIPIAQEEPLLELDVFDPNNLSPESVNLLESPIEY